MYLKHKPVHSLLYELVSLGRILLELFLGHLRHALADSRLGLVEHILRDVDECDVVAGLSSDLLEAIIQKIK